MTDNKNSSSNHDLQHTIQPENNKTRSPKQIHHTWWFWFFLVLMLAGIVYYVISLNFSMAPHRQVKQAIENTTTP